MKCETVKLSDICDFIPGFAFKSKDFGEYNTKVIKIANITPPTVDMNDLVGVDLSQYATDKLEKYKASVGDYVLAMTGATIGKIGRIKKGSAYINQRVLMFKNKSHVDKDYLYYVLQQRNFSQFIVNHIDSQSAQPNISAGTIGKYTFLLPSYDVQRKIASVLSAIDDKIETNKRINDNLLQQAQALYRSMFVDTDNSARTTCRADEFFDISIGKTPPRKEPQWFSDDPNNRVWVSISDMGSCGTFIDDSAEYLTEEAVTKHNVKIVPDNTVILSFKLTVGRVAITDGEVTTNEAIAHFKTDRADFTEYLYCYLKAFNYQTMGSTSSIATAVNSKIIKAMPFVVPTDEEIQNFHAFAGSAFSKIKALQRENKYLAELRDSLLPKLMAGEIDVSDVHI